MQEENNIKIVRKDNYFITQGMNDYNKKEVVISLDIDEKLANDILTIYCKKIIKNKTVPVKDDSSLNCSVYFKEVGNYIIIVFPDPYGKYPWDEDCTEEYCNQLELNI